MPYAQFSAKTPEFIESAVNLITRTSRLPETRTIRSVQLIKLRVYITPVLWIWKKRNASRMTQMHRGGGGTFRTSFKNSLISFCSGTNVSFPALNAKKTYFIIIYHCPQNTQNTYRRVSSLNKLKKIIFFK